MNNHGRFILLPQKSYGRERVAKFRITRSVRARRVVRHVVVTRFIAFMLGVTALVVPQGFLFAETASTEKRSALEEQIQALESEAASLDGKLQEVRGQARTVANELSAVNTQIKRRELEIRRLDLALQKTRSDIGERAEAIQELTEKIGRNKSSLAANIRLFYAYDQTNLAMAFFSHENISDFFNIFDALRRMQLNIKDTLAISREDRETLGREREALEQFQEEQQQLKSLQEVERRLLGVKRKEKENLLTLTKGNETLFSSILELKKRDIAMLRTQLFYLERTGITAEEAVRFAELASSRTGIRPAFLLALLEVETGKQFEDGVISVGTNLGTGHWEVDLYQCYIDIGKPKTAASQRDAFLAITSELGLDPDRMPVSRRPSYGCGGAMGPAQFIPTTWLLFKDRVTRLTGHNPANPWNVEDAFTASALYLADAGATSQTVAGETRAAKAYISGQPTCSRYICNSYASRIIALAGDIDRVL